MHKLLAPSLLLCLAGIAIAGCVDVVASSPSAVWVQKPLIAFGTVEGTAEAECARYGKRAVYRGTLEHHHAPSGGSAAAASGTRTVYVPIYAFDCE
jgi:hypothetical protein